MSSKGFSVRIFLQDGHADGVKIVARSGWSGRCIVIPRAHITEELKRKELNAPGLYVLIDDRQGSSLASLYIGANDPIYSDLDREWRKSFWNQAMVFSSKNDTLNLAQTQHLSMRLRMMVQSAQSAKLVKNQNILQWPDLSQSEFAEAESFLTYLLSICPVLGLRVFEMPGIET